MSTITPPRPRGRARLIRRLTWLAAPAVAAATIAGCGSSDAGAGTVTAAGRPSPAATARPDRRAVTVRTTEYSFDPMSITAKAGKVRLSLDNQGRIPHELVVLKTSRPPGSLAVSNGRVSEAGAVGEVSQTAAGATRSSTLDLKPGRYTFVCNIPGHYQDGMRGTLMVR